MQRLPNSCRILELTERLSTAKLDRLAVDLPGQKSRQALMILADASAFLNPPAAETPNQPAPDLATQRKILATTVNYVTRTLQQLPNFFATRGTSSFEDTPGVERESVHSSWRRHSHCLPADSSRDRLQRHGDFPRWSRGCGEKQVWFYGAKPGHFGSVRANPWYGADRFGAEVSWRGATGSKDRPASRQFSFTKYRRKALITRLRTTPFLPTIHALLAPSLAKPSARLSPITERWPSIPRAERFFG